MPFDVLNAVSPKRTLPATTDLASNPSQAVRESTQAPLAVKHDIVAAFHFNRSPSAISRLASVFDCLNATALKILKKVVHDFELFGRVPLPILDLTRDPKRIPGAV